MRALALAAVLVATPAAAAPLADCRDASAEGVAVTRCLEMRLSTANGDLEAAVVAATDQAQSLAAETGRDAALRTLVASEAAFAVYRERECARRVAVADTGTGAGDIGLACRAELAEMRATTLWGEVGGRPEAADGNGVVGREWRLVHIDGEPVLERTAPTLTLAEDGRAGGDASTNRFNAGYRLAGMGLAFGPAASTMMFNDQPEGRMAQEQRYLQLLGEVDRFALAGGKLLLIGDGRHLLEFE